MSRGLGRGQLDIDRYKYQKKYETPLNEKPCITGTRFRGPKYMTGIRQTNFEAV
jgi:hypothetical protein